VGGETGKLNEFGQPITFLELWNIWQVKRTISKDVTKFAIKIERSEIINQITVIQTACIEYYRKHRACSLAQAIHTTNSHVSHMCAWPSIFST